MSDLVTSGNRGITFRALRTHLKNFSANLLAAFGDIAATSWQTAVLVLLYLIPAAQALLPVDDPDIWWHLRTGQWIMEHGKVPTMDFFSSYGTGSSWIAYSWFFEIIVYGLHSAFGLVGLVLFTVLLSLMIAIALHLLVRRGNLPFTAEIGLTAIGLFCLKPQLSPRPWLFSILFLIIELYVLLSTVNSERSRRLSLLPLLFVCWANTHIQFVYGLAILLLFAAEPIVRQMTHPSAKLSDAELRRFRTLLFVTVLCFGATLINPYHSHIYRPVFEYALQTSVFHNIEELHPMFFQSPGDWLVLALALGAAFALGWRRETRMFPYFLLGFGAILAFRAKRDAWVLVVAALAVISHHRADNFVQDKVQFAFRKIILVAAGVILSLCAIGVYRDISEASLRAQVASVFPADAAAFAKNTHQQGPLYNHLDWGGYLIWTLPTLPVSMDGRTNLHGEQRIARSLSTWAGNPGWNADPELNNARLVIASIKQPLNFLLRRDSRFRLIYEDKVAAIFVANDTAK